MKYYICPNKRFLGLLDSLNKEKTAAILCSSYEIDIKKLEKFPNKLVLYFDDVCEVRSNAFNKEIATKIKLFVSSISNEITDMYICCDSGESRSSAICAALMKLQKQDEMTIWRNPYYHPNVLVYKLLCNELGIKESRLGLMYKEYINKNALRKAINRNRK